MLGDDVLVYSKLERPAKVATTEEAVREEIGEFVDALVRHSSSPQAVKINA
jgi:hypothetical protein